jgi:hypothetical protein
MPPVASSEQASEPNFHTDTSSVRLFFPQVSFILFFLSFLTLRKTCKSIALEGSKHLKVLYVPLGPVKSSAMFILRRSWRSRAV